MTRHEMGGIELEVEERRELLRLQKQNCEVQLRMISEKIRRAGAQGIKKNNPDRWMSILRERDSLRMNLYKTNVRIAATYPEFGQRS